MHNYSDFETVIGLEVHLQMNTQSKAFCSDQNQFGLEPNTAISEISLAFPGSLPVFNKAHIEKAILLGLALECDIAGKSIFDRKHYFYPDLPKGYQLTQEKRPICLGGRLDVKSGEGIRKVRIHHIHMEEDAGKSIHDLSVDSSMLDFNRAGVPLLEIVTYPDLRSGQEVHDFLTKLQQIARYLGISDANMEEGSMRCDCNISIRPNGSKQLGQRCEVKNLNSRRFAKMAIEFESKRQINQSLAGHKIEQQTLHYDSTKNKTVPSREKEEAHDYRYFPDPDLPPVLLDTKYIEHIRESMPLLPKAVKQKLSDELGVSAYDAEIISGDHEVANTFIELSKKTDRSDLLAKLFVNKLIPLYKQSSDKIFKLPIHDKSIFEFLELIDDGTISHSAAYQRVFPRMIESNKSPKAIIEEMGLRQDSDLSSLKSIIDQLLLDYPEETKRYKAGKKALIGFFIGEAMKRSGAKANPKMLKQLLEQSFAN